MVTYYTALGRLATKEERGTKIPVVIIDDEEFHIGPDELMVWISIHWNFLNRTDLEKEYERRRQEARLFNDISFEYIVNRLEQRNMIVSATEYLAADALYELISKLRIRPVTFSMYDRLKSCLYLYFIKGLPVKICLKAYFGEKLSADEKKIIKLAENTGITASEIIKCAEENIDKIKDEEDIITKLYDDPDTTQETIEIASRLSRLKTDVLQSVTNLYLKKKIVFE